MNLKDGGVENIVVAQRKLHDTESGEVIEATIFIPRKDRTTKRGDWVVSVHVRTGDKVERFDGHGVDSLQALISGLSALRFALRSRSERLKWLGGPGEIGLPLMVHDEDPDFLALTEHLIAAEHSRQVIAAKHARTRATKRVRQRRKR
jgi:hypothetical protein